MNLFISTATDKIYLMLFDQKQIIKTSVYQGKNNHTEKLYEQINELAIDLTKIESVYVVNGPGSYTGLRVGVIFAKTLAMQLNINVYPVGLMPALYYSNNCEQVYVDAKGKKYYCYNGGEISVIPAAEVQDGLIDPLIDLEALYASNYLAEISSVPFNELTINYVKTAI